MNKRKKKNAYCIRINILIQFVLLCLIVAALSKNDSEHHQSIDIIVDQCDKPTNRFDKRLPFNGYSDEFLDRLETNGNVLNDKHIDRYSGKFNAIEVSNINLCIEQAHGTCSFQSVLYI